MSARPGPNLASHSEAGHSGAGRKAAGRNAATHRGGPVLVTVLVLAGAAASFLASTPWLRAYQVGDAPCLLALAAVVPFLTSAFISRQLRFPSLLSYGVSATALVVLLGVSNGFDFNSVWDGLAHVPPQLLSETLPLSGGAYLLTAPVVLTWLCATACAELLLRPRQPSAIALAVPIAYFALAFAATTSAPPGATLGAGAGLLGAAVVAALARQGLLDAEVANVQAIADATGGPATRNHRHASLRRALTGSALAAAVAGALAVAVSGMPAFAARPRTVSRPTQLISGTVVNPLDQLASLRNSDLSAAPRALFTVRTKQAWSGYITVANLDQYDGGMWSFADTFRPTGGRVPSSQPVTEPGTREVVQHYDIVRSIGLPFLPELDRPVSVTGLAVDAEARSGMLAATVHLPAAYGVTSLVPVATSAGLAPGSALASGSAVPGGDSEDYTALPTASGVDLLTAVRFSVNLTGRPASPSFSFLQNLAGWLRAHEKRVSPSTSTSGTYIPAALAGTSLAQVINAVTIDHAATPEQFATFFAMVARYLGVPARVVTGFRVPAAAASSASLPAGTYRLTNRDAWAWAEIPVLGYGWVVVDATPVLTTADVSAPPEQVQPARPTKPDQETAVPGHGAAHAIAKPVRAHLTRLLHVNWVLILGVLIPGGVIVALLIAFLGVPALRRRLRRLARHQEDDPAALAAGAWLELVDGLFRLGLEVGPSATSTQVVERVADRFGDDFGPPTSLVAALADQALYSTRWPVDESRAQLAWHSQHVLRRRLRHQVGRRERAQALLMVGPSPPRRTAEAQL